MKVYVITKGCYSDYHICAVTTDKQKAQGLEKLFGNTGYFNSHIEEYDTENFTNEADLALLGYQTYGLRFDENGHYEDISHHDDADYVSAYNDVSCWTDKITGNKRYFVYVLAKDEEHAIKIASDLVAEYRYRKEVEEYV